MKRNVEVESVFVLQTIFAETRQLKRCGVRLCSMGMESVMTPCHTPHPEGLSRFLLSCHRTTVVMRRGADGLRYFLKEGSFSARTVAFTQKQGSLHSTSHYEQLCNRMAETKLTMSVAPVLKSGSFLTISPRSFRQHTLRACKMGRPPTPSLRSLSLTVARLQPTAKAPHPALRHHVPVKKIGNK